MNEAYWRIRIVINRGSTDEAGELAAHIRQQQHFHKASKRDYSLVVERHTPAVYANDSLSATIHALDLLYRDWPEGSRLPGWMKTSVEYVPAKEVSTDVS